MQNAEWCQAAGRAQEKVSESWKRKGVMFFFFSFSMSAVAIKSPHREVCFSSTATLMRSTDCCVFGRRVRLTSGSQTWKSAHILLMWTWYEIICSCWNGASGVLRMFKGRRAEKIILSVTFLATLYFHFTTFRRRILSFKSTTLIFITLGTCYFVNMWHCRDTVAQF